MQIVQRRVHMKKLLVLILTICMLLTAMAGAAFGAEADTIKEAPDIKIVMEGAITKYKNVPVSVKGSNLLPLREMLVNLGVPNDDEHIIYNSEDKSVAIKYGQTTILLKIGDTKAYVNDEPLTLNAAPVLYKNSTYIPIRFVAEALGKKVVWDGATRSVLVCDKASFESIEELLKKSNEASANVKKYRIGMDIDAVSGSGAVKFGIGIKADAAVDKAGKKMYMEMLIKMLGLELNVDSYFADNKTYTSSPFDGAWEMKTYTDKEYEEMFESQTITNPINVREALCAGLVLEENAADNEIVLSGDVYLADLYANALEQQGSILGSDQDTIKSPKTFDTYDLRMIIDKDTYLLKSLVMKVSAVEDNNGQKVTTDITVTLSFSDYNGDFKVIVPDEVKQNAVEAETTDGSGGKSKS